MPIFEYRCQKCGNDFEELVSGDRNKQIPCPSCGSEQTEKLMSVIGGISMGRGSGAPACAANCAGASACAASGGACCGHAG